MLNSIGEEINPNHDVSVRDAGRSMRVVISGRVVAESDHPLILTEAGHETFYFPPDDVDRTLLTATGPERHCPYKGDWRHLDVTVGDKTIESAAWRYHHALVECPRIKDYVAFYPNKADPESTF